MSVFRINKNKNYTVMSNYHLKDKTLSLKAKGLLSIMLSLPDNWDYSIQGLTKICKEGEMAIKSSLSELKEHSYLIMTKENNAKGQFCWIYDIFEAPQPYPENPPMVNPPMVNPSMEYQGQLNTKDKILKNKKKSKKKKTKTNKLGKDKIPSNLEDVYLN